MTDNTNNNALLAQALEQQNKQLLCMLNALQEEHTALSSSDIESFEKAVRNKHDQVAIIEQMQSQLSAFEPMLNGKFSKSTLENYINHMPKDEQRSHLKKLWEQLHDTTNQCSEPKYNQQ